MLSFEHITVVGMPWVPAPDGVAHQPSFIKEHGGLHVEHILARPARYSLEVHGVGRNERESLPMDGVETAVIHVGNEGREGAGVDAFSAVRGMPYGRLELEQEPLEALVHVLGHTFLERHVVIVISPVGVNRVVVEKDVVQIPATC